MSAKKTLSVLLVVVFAVLLCGCSVFSEKPTGYNGTIWGSSKAEVKNVENSENLLLDLDDTLIYTDFDLSNPISRYGFTISEAPLIEYHFTDGKLSEIAVTLEGNSISYESAKSVFDDLKTKYGDAELKQDWSLTNEVLISEWATFKTKHTDIFFRVSENGILESKISLTLEPLESATPIVMDPWFFFLLFFSISLIAFALFLHRRNKLLQEKNQSEDAFWYKTHTGSSIINVSRVKLFSASTRQQLLEKFAAIDVETTGLNPYGDEIVHFSIVLFKDGKVDKTYSSYFRPTVPFSPEAAKVNGLSAFKLRKAPYLNEKRDELRSVFRQLAKENYIFVAHNASFDFDFIRTALGTFGEPFTVRVADTLAFARRVVDAPNYKLDTLCRWLSVEGSPDHSALNDAIACGNLMVTLINRFESESE